MESYIALGLSCIFAMNCHSSSFGFFGAYNLFSKLTGLCELPAVRDINPPRADIMVDSGIFPVYS